MITFDNVREWIEEARKFGELNVIEGADPHVEVGAIDQINCKNEGPALLFTNLKDHDNGFRILTSHLANIRLVNFTFGLPIEYSIQETIGSLRMKIGEWAQNAKNFPIKVVDTGPILENIEEGDHVDLNKFPVPLWHELDGGKFIGTADGVITRDPDTGDLNMGTYRVQLHDGQTLGNAISPGKHGRMHRDKYFKKGQPCPVVMIFGHDPLNFTLACHEIPTGIFELDYLGAIRGESVPIIAGKVTGLPIPANAEIAIEGFVYPEETLPEGPFGEWPGTYNTVSQIGARKREMPFVRVAALYYRNDAVLLGAPPAKGMYSSHGFIRSIWRSAILHNEIDKSGIPNVEGVFCPAFGGSRLFTIVSIKQSYAGHATEVGHVASQTRAGAYVGRYVVVVDEDINPYDIEDVMWAICTRSDPLEIDFIKRAWASGVDPRIKKPAEYFTPMAPKLHFHNTRGIIYAVKPIEWYQEFPMTNVASEELRKQMFSKWAAKMKDRWKVI
ncbi:UbiD family decarboxylase [Thermodesulfobacteriota bacterium]